MSSNWSDATGPEHHSDPTKEAVHYLVIAESYVNKAIRCLGDLPSAQDEARLIQGALLAMVDHRGKLS